MLTMVRGSRSCLDAVVVAFHCPLAFDLKRIVSSLIVKKIKSVKKNYRRWCHDLMCGRYPSGSFPCHFSTFSYAFATPSDYWTRDCHFERLLSPNVSESSHDGISSDLWPCEPQFVNISTWSPTMSAGPGTILVALYFKPEAPCAHFRIHFQPLSSFESHLVHCPVNCCRLFLHCVFQNGQVWKMASMLLSSWLLDVERVSMLLPMCIIANAEKYDMSALMQYIGGHMSLDSLAQKHSHPIKWGHCRWLWNR